ncbi:MAG: prepilin-type N-terminal cleavage/methylation domain-containing protein [Elusimicrobiales bacterium]
MLVLIKKAAARLRRLLRGFTAGGPRRAGVSLVELMIAMAVITIGVTALMGSFKYINYAMAQSRLKTIATNLAQEKMEVLKNKPYFQLMVTTATSVTTGFDENFSYDSSNYPPEVISLWGKPALTRAVKVEYVSISGSSVSLLPYNSDDPGMKKITVYVFWQDKDVHRKMLIESYYQNPSAATLSAGFKGVVTENGVPAQGILVHVSGTPKWYDYSDSGGNYSFQVAPGTYSLVCSSAGFYSQATDTELAVTKGVYTVKDFSVVRIGTGTVASSSIYAVNPGLVISQVVASTVQAGGFDAQYIELFNPTEAPINVGSAASHPVSLHFTSKFASQLCTDIPLVYVSTFVPPGRYYLIANAASFTVGGLTLAADAYFTDTANNSCTSPTLTGWSAPTVKPILIYGHSGTVWLTGDAGATIDAVGWTSGGNAPDHCETNCIYQANGLRQGDQVARFSTPCTPGVTYGRAYDSGDNSGDFYFNDTGSAAGIPYRPFNSASPSQLSLSGVPALSAFVMVDDGNSAAVTSSISSLTGAQGQVCAYSSFTIVGVSTGVWTVTAVHGNYMRTISTVTVAQNVLTSVPNALTIPAWQVAGLNYTAVSSTYSGGLASGYVYGAGLDYWMRLPGKVVGSSDGNYTATDARGWYFLQVSTGEAVIHANYQSADGNYMTSDAYATILQGAVTDIPDFHLARGGYIKGYVTSGTGALPNIPVRATSGGAVYNDTTDDTGYFYIFAATDTVAYTITPELDPLQGYSSLPTDPLTISVTEAGVTVFAGSITVTGALGTISGSVTDGGEAITTGVLLVASTATVPAALPAITALTAPAQSVFYFVSSKSDGTYSLEVRSSTSATYNLRAFYPKVDGNSGSVTHTSKSLSSISVSAGGEVTGKNFAWP